MKLIACVKKKIGVVADAVVPCVWAFRNLTWSVHLFIIAEKRLVSPQTIASDGSSQDGGSSSAAITPTGTPPYR